MKRFGYLGKPSDTEALITENAFVDSLRRLQTFGRIPPSGKVDEATIKLLNSPRCGNSDYVSNRRKRFAIGSNGWKKRQLSYQ